MAEYIDRERLLRKFNIDDMMNVNGTLISLREARETISNFPAADIVPVQHGRWIEDHDYLKCPECSVMVKWDFTFFDIGDWNYCPNCGAKMDGAE